MKEISIDQVYHDVGRFLMERVAEFDQVPPERKATLEQLAGYVRDQLASIGTANLTLICTHNSRRSHLAQIWAKVAADVYQLEGVATFSGGTEATAMNPRVVDSLRRTGLRVETNDRQSQNPVYQVAYSDHVQPLFCFSKVFDAEPNPKSGYCAVMTCSSADEACPIVPGCDLRLPVRYDDPKAADDTPDEASVYDERSRQICREMLYMARNV